MLHQLERLKSEVPAGAHSDKPVPLDTQTVTRGDVMATLHPTRFIRELRLPGARVGRCVTSIYAMVT